MPSMSVRLLAFFAGVAAVLLIATGCGHSTAPAQSAERITLYTSVTQDTVSAVVAGFQAAHPGATVDVFRATTGQLNARIAADVRSGGLRADVIWATDPLSMQSYASQNLLHTWPLPQLSGVPAQFRSQYFWGTRILTLVIVARKGLTPAPKTWADLANPQYRGAVAVPDPATAGSAFAALGYFSQQPGYGIDFYRRLKANGAVQVATVPQVVTDVAQGKYRLGITLETEVRMAARAGSPVEPIWPSDGGIALYSPIAQTTRTDHAAAAQDWLRYVLSADGQKRIALTGWQPVVPGTVGGTPVPPGAHQVYPDWTTLFGKQNDLLRQYQAIFG
jgi:iron(III) transport system substrate-binding protein